MDILTDKLFSIKDSLQEGILVLPHLLSGFFFFIGILTSNIGMLCLAFGHFFIVPSISVFANNDWKVYNDKGFDFGGLFRPVLAGGVLAICLVGFLGASAIIPILFALKFAIDAGFANSHMTLFDTINPYVWFNGTIKKKKESTVDLCYLSPEDTFGTDQRRTPSGWTIHLLFFAGFLISNAARIYALPVPNISTSGDTKIDANNKEQIDILVNNRKIITGTVIGLAILVVVVLLYVQYTMTPCEDTIYESLFPMIYCILFGVSWYTFLTDSCGIPASDILGLVQGFISPTAITNPIVCVGSTNPPPAASPPPAATVTSAPGATASINAAAANATMMAQRAASFGQFFQGQDKSPASR